MGFKIPLKVLQVKKLRYFSLGQPRPWKCGAGDSVVVTKLDRIARSTKHLLEITDLLKRGRWSSGF